MFFTKSQSSLEFMTIFGIGFSIIVVLGGIFFGFFSGEKSTLDKEHMDNVGREIINNIEKAYFMGYGNRFTMETSFPEGIENFTIIHRNNVAVGLENVSYDYINITYMNDNLISSFIYTTNEVYIRFNCTQCYHDNVNNVSYFNVSDFNSGNKRIKFESQGDWVLIDFMKN